MPDACMQFVAPLEPLIVTSRFGPRPRVLADGKTPGPLHPGIDFRADFRQIVRAVAPGIVLKSYLSQNLRRVFALDEEGKAIPGSVAQLVPYAWRPGDKTPDVMGFGETVLIQHEGGLLTRYAHLERRLVLEGAHVEAGQPLGQAGTTGYSFGVHVHFEVRGDGGRSLLDPLPLFLHLAPTVF